MAGVPDLETRVAWPEIVFLLIAGPIWDVAFSINAEQRAVGIGHDEAVKIVRPLLLEDGDGQDDAQFAC